MGKMERRTCFSTGFLLTDGAGQINSDAWTSQKTGSVCLFSFKNRKCLDYHIYHIYILLPILRRFGI